MKEFKTSEMLIIVFQYTTETCNYIQNLNLHQICHRQTDR